MAEQRKPSRFRFPWSAAPRPNQETQGPSSPQSPVRRPSRSARSGAPPTRPPPAKAEPPTASSSSTRTGPSSRSTSRSAPERPITSPNRERGSPVSRAVSQTQSPSPSRGVGQQAKSIATVAKPPRVPGSTTLELEQESKSLSTQEKKPITSDIAEPQKDQKEKETSPPSSTKPLFMDTKTPQTEEVEKLKGKGQLPASEETEFGHESRKEVYETSVKEPMEILKGMDCEELKKNSVTRDAAQDSKAKTELLNALGQHPKEETFDQKEILKIFGNNEKNAKSEHFGLNKGSSFKHKHTDAEEKTPLDKGNKEDLPKSMHMQAARQDKHAWNEKPLSIITLTGENTGATMHLISEPARRERPIHIHRGYKAGPDESVDTVTDEESSRSRKTTNTKDEDETRKKLYVNTNAQGINNSLVFKSSVTERNPGAHVVLSHDAAVSVKSGKEVETCDTHKAEVRPALAERLTYAPRIRRRCLRGLLLESSDSDPGNSEKRQHHGCRA